LYALARNSLWVGATAPEKLIRSNNDKALKPRPIRKIFFTSIGCPLFHGLIGPVNRAVGYGKDFDLAILLLIITGVPDIGKAQVGQATGFVLGGDDPLPLLVQIFGAQDQLTLGVGEAAEMGGDHIVLAAHYFLPISRFLLITEKFHLHIGQGPTVDGIGGKKKRALVQGLFNNDGIMQPDHDLTGIAVLHPAGQQVGARFFQRSLNGDAFVKVTLRRLQVQGPFGGFCADILVLLFGDQTITDIFDVHFVPIQVGGIGFQILLYVAKQFRDQNGMGGETDMPAVAEAVFDGRRFARSLGHDRFELTPMAQDLVEFFLLVMVRTRTELLNASAPEFGGAVILTPVFENFSQSIDGFFRIILVFIGGDLLIDPDVVGVIGQFEALDAGGQARQGFVFFQGMELIGFVLTGLAGFRGPVEVRGIIGQGLHAELVVEKVGVLEQGLVDMVGLNFHGPVQQPAPSLLASP